MPQAHPKALRGKLGTFHYQCSCAGDDGDDDGDDGGKLGTSYYQCSCASDDGGEDENGYF